MRDVWKGFTWNLYDAKVGKEIIKREATPEAVTYFAEVCEKLSNYGYWFYLSTLWVSYAGHSDLDLWKELFSSSRGQRLQCIMKPSELQSFERLPYFVTAYRAHRPGETDWIAYTLDPVVAARFARERGVGQVSEYKIKKRDIVGLFLRRGESEILVLDKEKPEFIKEHGVIIQ